MEGRHFRRCGFTSWALVATCGILAAAVVAPSAWAGSPAQGEYHLDLPNPGNGGGPGANGGDLNQRLNAMEEGDLLRVVPGNITVRTSGFTPGGATRRERLFRLRVGGEQQRTIAGADATALAILDAYARSTPPDSLGGATNSSAWSVAWILLFVVPVVAFASAAGFRMRRRRSGPSGTVQS